MADDPIHQSIFPTSGFWQMIEDHLVNKLPFIHRLQHALNQDYMAKVVATQSTPFVGASVRRILSPSGTAPSGMLPVYDCAYIPAVGDQVWVRALPGGTKQIIAGTTASASGAHGGTVTSVGLSAPAGFSVSGTPVTGSGTLALSYATGQTQNEVLATPDGTTGALSLRSLVSGDIPNLPASKITSGTLAVAQGGTNAATASANTTFAGPTSGSAAAPSFRALVAADIPSLPASQITSGTLAIAQGGTNAATASANLAFIGPTSGGAAAPSFRALVAADVPAVNPSALTGSGTVPLAGLSGITTSQLSATAGIVAGQLAVSAPTSGQIGGLTTSNLSATAGITSGQIASIPTHASTHLSGGSDDLIQYTLAGSQISTMVEVIPRFYAQSSNVINTGDMWFAFFTSPVSLTVSNFNVVTHSSNGQSGGTLLRLGLFTITNSTNIDLAIQARSADIHTTVGTSTSALFTVAFDTGSSFPSSYSLVAGTRYAIGMIFVGTTGPTWRGYTLIGAMANMVPVLLRKKSGQSDFPTSPGGAVTSITTANGLGFWAALT